MVSFLWSEWGVEWVYQMLWHCGSEGTACCWMNATSWKQNGISLHRVCCLLDCDLLWCWINRWIRLWKEMIGWFCRLFLLSSDNLSVGEESCEYIIPWFLDPNSFDLTPISLTSSRVRVSQLQSSPLLSILIKSYSIHCLVSINSTLSDSSQWSLFNRINLFRHLFPFYSPFSYPFWCTTTCTNQLLRIGMNAFSLSLCILYH